MLFGLEACGPNEYIVHGVQMPARGSATFDEHVPAHCMKPNAMVYVTKLAVTWWQCIA